MVANVEDFDGSHDEVFDDVDVGLTTKMKINICDIKHY